MLVDKYRFIHALRPFSLSVGFFACMTGILIASREGYADYLTAALILFAGLLLQIGVNLINDLSDLPQLNTLELSVNRKNILRNAYIGLACFVIAGSIGLYFVSITGPVLFLLFLVGLAGALGYTLEPINYKRRGLAVVLVFWLMGVLMVVGTYFILSLSVSLNAFLLSIPVSLYTSLLLLSNELRDYEEDGSVGIRTLSVRLGYVKGALLYKALVGLVYLTVWLLGLIDNLFLAGLISIALIVSLLPCRLLSRERDERSRLTQETGRSFLMFGLIYCVLLVG